MDYSITVILKMSKKSINLFLIFAVSAGFTRIPTALR